MPHISVRSESDQCLLSQSQISARSELCMQYQSFEQPHLFTSLHPSLVSSTPNVFLS